jgi:hypothetical protein
MALAAAVLSAQRMNPWERLEKTVPLPVSRGFAVTCPVRTQSAGHPTVPLFDHNQPTLKHVVLERITNIYRQQPKIIVIYKSPGESAF